MRLDRRRLLQFVALVLAVSAARALAELEDEL